MNYSQTAVKLLVVNVMALASFGCDRPYFESELESGSPVNELLLSFSNTKFETAADLEYVLNNAVACERSIVFVNVDWSLYMPLNRRKFAEFSIAYNDLHPDTPVMFHYTDASRGNYVPYETLEGSREVESYRFKSLIHGNGELFWLEKGRVVHIEPIQNFTFVSDLIDKTNQLKSANLN